MPPNKRKADDDGAERIALLEAEIINLKEKVEIMETVTDKAMKMINDYETSKKDTVALIDDINNLQTFEKKQATTNTKVEEWVGSIEKQLEYVAVKLLDYIGLDSTRTCNELPKRKYTKEINPLHITAASAGPQKNQKLSESKRPAKDADESKPPAKKKKSKERRQDDPDPKVDKSAQCNTVDLTKE